MKTVTLGRTGITVCKNGFGALPIQRVGQDCAGKILRKAYDAGITYFDTARAYTDSEEKIGRALSDVRQHIVLATKTMATTVEGFWSDLETSLRLLKTDYIDVYQLHNPAFCPRPGDGSGLYEAMLEARDKGMIRFLGLTNHRIHVASEAAASGLYDTLQFPFSYLATDKELELIRLCEGQNVGFVAMKALSGGLITNAAAAYAWQASFPNVLPIWGIQREWELDEFLRCMETSPSADDPDIRAVIDRDRAELIGDFCRSCGYCMPCPAGIEIRQCARMSQLIRRSPSQPYLTAETQAMMRKINDCLECGQCKAKCPYSLDTPNLLKKNLADYEDILAGRVKI